jgi:serine/threonine protein kinase
MCVQEYCNGGSLRHAVAKGYFNPEATPRHWRIIMGLLNDVAQGMAYIHSKRICHGDLNPANVLLKARPTERWFLCLPCLQRLLQRCMERTQTRVVSSTWASMSSLGAHERDQLIELVCTAAGTRCQPRCGS